MKIYSGPLRLSKDLDIPVFDNVSLLIHQLQTEGSVTGWMVWPVAIAFCDYISKNRHMVQNKHIIELGSGTGLVGMALSLMGAASVVITDIPEGLKMCEHNYNLNRLKFPQPATIQVQPLFWGDEDQIKRIKERFSVDVIVGTDIVYHQSEEVLQALVGTIISLSHSETKLILAYEDREGMIEDESYFFGPLRDVFGCLELVDIGNNRFIYVFSKYLGR